MSEGTSVGGRQAKPTKAELAAARLAAAEPAVAGLVPKRARPAIPDPATTGAVALGVPASRTGRRWRTTAIAIGLVAFVAAIAGGIFEGDHTRASSSTARSTVPSGSAGPQPSASPAAFISLGSGTTAGDLVLANGQVLYYNDQDGAAPNGVPACVGACSTVWRPLAPSETVPLTASPDVIGSIYTIVRPDDGSTQVTFNGHPLYEFTIDAPGHMTGNGLIDSFNGQAFSWHAASATDTPVIPSPPPSPAPSASTAIPTPSSSSTGAN